MDIKCEVCNNSRYKKPSLIKKHKHHYCSQECRVKALNTDRVPWNKGTKGVCKPNSGSISKGQRLSPDTEFKPTGVKYSGTLNQYKALHHWVNSNLGNAKVCEHCKSTSKNVYHWANKSGQYKKELNDWLRLCVRCHYKYDRGSRG